MTSDNTDATWAEWSGSGAGMVLITPPSSPPAGERRHQIRTRVRGADGDAWWSVILNSGVLVGGSSAQFDSSPETVAGSWGFGVPPDGTTGVSAYITGQSGALNVYEVYVDVDTREAPSFTPQVLDGSGATTTLVSDTATPTVVASSIDLDDLSARSYRYWVTRDGATVWDTGLVSGPAVGRQTNPLANGVYTAHLQIWSTLGQNLPYASDEETVDFTVSVGAVPRPENPTVTPVPDTPFYDLEVCAPYVGDFDSGQGYIEIQRVDCPIGGSLALPGLEGAYASAPDPVTALTGLQVTVIAERDDDWQPAGDETLAAQFDDATDNRSWSLYVDSTGGSDPALIGRPVLSWSEDGTAGTLLTAAATDRPAIGPYGDLTVRATLTPDNGSGDWEVLFETFDDEWLPLGEVVTGTGTTSLFDSTAAYTVGAQLTTGPTTAQPFTGRITYAEVRNGSAGAVVASPDFAGHMAGTSTFTDSQGNVWTVHGSAAVTSDQRLNTVAILGPLDTDECVTFRDFTFPRTGIGGSCSHDPEQCCSYYRARTVGRVDGQLQTSQWSSVYEPGIPSGIIFLWPSTVASIPDGWNREDALNDLYLKGVATSVTQPGTIAGAADHTHTTPGHVHDISHSHTVTGNTSAAVGAVSSTTGAAGNAAIAATHTHTVPSTNSETVTSGSTQPVIDAVDNELDRLSVIAIKSNGQPLGIPDGALALTGDISLTGWTDHAAATGRYLKGAAAAANGGVQSANTLSNHDHPIGAHTHTGTAHTHGSANAGSVASNLTLQAGPNSVTWTTSHSHPITIGNTSTAALASGGSGTSGTTSQGATHEPPFRNVRVKENTSGGDDLPVGVIGVWRGSLGSIPDHWALCDGAAGTPDLTGRYPKAETSSIGTTGGSLATHTHTSPTHTHTTSGHTHTMTIGAQNSATANVSATATVSVANGTHTHTHGATDSATPTVVVANSGTLAATGIEPLHEEVAFIQLIEEATPPDDPTVFCLEWSDDEHLIRTTGPGGPMWAPIIGQFEWDVDRPFTASIGLMGGRYVASASPGGRNLKMTAAVESEADLRTLREILSRPLVLVSPSDSTETWAAPISTSVRVIKVGRIRQVTAEFIGTGPQPGPQLADVAV